MVKLSSELVYRKIKKPGQDIEIDKKALRKLTHLHLQDNSIDSIGDISLCKNLTVLYLQNNCLTKIENIDYATHLTHLYLQANKINKIENLNGLKKLKKLYLGHNCIAVIEGLDKLCNLQELHIQKQNLPQGETLHFDPRTTKSLARCLRILDISANGLTSIAELENLLELQHLIARNNCINNINDITDTVSHWTCLTEMELQGNPVCLHQKYRERIITCSNSLVSLDGKNINDNTRDFLRRLEISKTGRQMAPYLVNNAPTLSPEIAYLTKNFTPGVRNSITQSIFQDAEYEAISSDSIKKLDKCSFFPPWKTCTSTETFTKTTPLVPRPFWRQVNIGQPSNRRTKKIIENLSLPRI